MIEHPREERTDNSFPGMPRAEDGRVPQRPETAGEQGGRLLNGGAEGSCAFR